MSARFTNSLLLIGLLAALTATGPVAMQIFLPALPIIQTSFATSAGIVQLTLSLSMLAIAMATLVYGPLSDRFGRRPVMLGGMLIFLAGSLLCAVANSIETLIAARVLQACGGAAGMVLTRAIARDRFGPEGAARVIAQLTLVMVVAPMIAPAVGGVLTDLFDWRAAFWATTLMAIVLLVLAYARLGESLPENTAPAGFFATFQGVGELFGSRQFVGAAAQTAFTSMIFFAFISGAPYLMAHTLNRPPSEYGLYFVLVSGGFMVGNFIALRIGHRVDQDKQRLVGAVIALAGTLVLALITMVDALTTLGPLALFLPIFFGSIGNGLVMPAGQAAAMHEFPHRAGTASGLSGFLQMLCAAAASQFVGVFQNGTAWPMLICMLIGGVGGVLAIHFGSHRAALLARVRSS